MKSLWLAKAIKRKLLPKYSIMHPDFVIGDNFMHRWWLILNRKPDGDTDDRNVNRPGIRRSRFLNCYLHLTLKSDSDRHLHDHPWVNISIILAGRYIEVFEDQRVLRKPGDIVFRLPSKSHRLILIDGQPVWTLFLTWKKVREWGFRTIAGWIHWKDYTDYLCTGDSSKSKRTTAMEEDL